MTVWRTLALLACAQVLHGCTAENIEAGGGERFGSANQAVGWDPGLHTRRARARNGGFESLLDPDPRDRAYTLIPILESGTTPNTSPYVVNDPQGPFRFDWAGGPVANLLIDTVKPVSQVASNPKGSYTFLGFYETVGHNGAAPLPPPAGARWQGQLMRDGPYHSSSFKQEDGRIAAGIAWEEAGQTYIVELNLHSGQRNPGWLTGPSCVSNTTHHGLVAQYVVLGGFAWGLPAVSDKVYTSFDIDWGGLLLQLQRRTDACRLNATLGSLARTLEIGVGVEAHGRVQERLLVRGVTLRLHGDETPTPAPGDCSTCLQLGGFAAGIDCNRACQLIGKAGGSCAFPGSADRARCCGCTP